MKTVILIAGVYHSKSSMVAKFLHDNGAVLVDGPDRTFKGRYLTYEDKTLRQYCLRLMKFKKLEGMFANYVRGLEDNKTYVMKYPNCIWFLDILAKEAKEVGARFKVVFILRNPIDLFLSHKEKNDESLAFVLSKYKNALDAAERFGGNLHVCLVDRLVLRNSDEATNLLLYCGLFRQQINYKSIGPQKSRNFSYKEYRIRNFLWKRLGFMFKL